MKGHSALGHRGPVPWQGLLLAVSLSTFWIPPITAKPTVESAPLNAAEGQDVLLLVRSVTGNPVRYEWYKGATVDSNQRIASYVVPSQENSTGPAHSGRETLYTNGSLLIQKVTQNDTGSYTFSVFYSDGNRDTAAGQLRVHQSVAPPSIQASNTTVTEHKDQVVLTCLTRDTGISILWFLNNQRLQLTDRRTLSQDNRTLTINPVRREDSGDYQCEVTNLVSFSKSNPITLTVKAGGDTTGLSAGAKTDIVIGVIVLVVLTAALGCVVLVKSPGRTSGQHNLREQQSQASTPGACLPGRGPDPSSHSASWTSRPDARSSVPIYEELQDSSANIYCQINYEADVVS